MSGSRYRALLWSCLLHHPIQMSYSALTCAHDRSPPRRGHWWLPRRLRQIRQRFTPAGRELYDSRMQRPVARLLFALPLPVGAMGVIIGVVLLVSEG